MILQFSGVRCQVSRVRLEITDESGVGTEELKPEH